LSSDVDNFFSGSCWIIPAGIQPSPGDCGALINFNLIIFEGSKEEMIIRSMPVFRDTRGMRVWLSSNLALNFKLTISPAGPLTDFYGNRMVRCVQVISRRFFSDEQLGRIDSNGSFEWLMAAISGTRSTTVTH
jgi:hypothetical protein